MKEETREEEEKRREERRDKRRSKTREEKRREDKKREEARQEKSQDEEREMKEKIFFKKNVPGHSNPPDELAQNVSKKNPFRTNYSSIFSAKVQNLAVFSFIYMIRIRFFGPQELIQKYFRRAR